MSDNVNSFNIQTIKTTIIPNLNMQEAKTENHFMLKNNLTINKQNVQKNNSLNCKNLEIKSKIEPEINNNDKSSDQNNIYNLKTSQNIFQANNIYKEIRRPLNRNNNNASFLDSNLSNNNQIRSFGEKNQNLDIIEYTENSFISPETEFERVVTNTDRENIKLEKHVNIQEKQKLYDDYNNDNDKEIINSNINNSSKLNRSEKSKIINYRFKSPAVENNINSNDDDNLLVMKSPIKNTNQIEFNDSISVNKQNKWDNKSYYSHKIFKHTDKINNSMISNLSYKSNNEHNLKISISNGIIDINKYETAMNSTKNNKTDNQNTANLFSHTKENNPSINFISSMINNRNLLGNEYLKENKLKDVNHINVDNNENNRNENLKNYNKLVSIENDKAPNLNKYKQNDILMLEKNLNLSSLNFRSNQNERFHSEEKKLNYNDISTDKQYTLEKQYNENNLNSNNQNDMFNSGEEKKIKRNKSGLPFVQLQKSILYFYEIF